VGIPFYDYTRSFGRQSSDLLPRIDGILAGAQLTNGPTCRALEGELQRYTGARYAVAVGNASDALVMLLKAAGVGPGDEVIVPCFTFFSSASSIVHVGATPVFVDIDQDTYSLDVDAVANAITPRTKAVMPVHLFTQMADMSGVANLAREHGFEILEDSAEGVGMWYDGVHAGLLGRGGVLSFFPTKTLGTFGDGGLVLTDDDEIAEAVCALRDHGRKPGNGGTLLHPGYNSKMDEIHAAILLTRLPYLAGEIAQRAFLARQYDDRLGRLNGLVRTPRIVARRGATNPVYYVYLIEVEERDALTQHLSERDIGTEQYYPMPLHLQPCFQSLGYARGSFPNAERASTRTLALPLFPDMGPAAVDAVCGVIEDFYNQGRRRQ
jgi:UDP-2-acetamido-2-deoxy-ribo-hexuluronate aminotransferase